MTRTQRRVAGVLVEKAKTTPEAYPMTLNALTNGCNQKSNRSPQMNLSTEEVEDTLDELRELGVVLEVQGGGRVAKYRHLMYEWLGVSKTEMAVMTELLLRGEQTVGELRSRASRMEPIASLNDLKPILQSLMEKKLVVSLTPEGRGQLVTHALYTDREFDAVKSRAGAQVAATSSDARSGAVPAAEATTAAANLQTEFDALRGEIQALRQEVAQLRDRVEKFENLLH
jgi:uncharacterized protein YceH (UPF0502 family)